MDRDSDPAPAPNKRLPAPHVLTGRLDQVINDNRVERHRRQNSGWKQNGGKMMRAAKNSVKELIGWKPPHGHVYVEGPRSARTSPCRHGSTGQRFFNEPRLGTTSLINSHTSSPVTPLSPYVLIWQSLELPKDQVGSKGAVIFAGLDKSATISRRIKPRMASPAALMATISSPGSPATHSAIQRHAVDVPCCYDAEPSAALNSSTTHVSPVEVESAFVDDLLSLRRSTSATLLKAPSNLTAESESCAGEAPPPIKSGSHYLCRHVSTSGCVVVKGAAIERYNTEGHLERRINLIVDANSSQMIPEEEEEDSEDECNFTETPEHLKSSVVVEACCRPVIGYGSLLICLSRTFKLFLFHASSLSQAAVLDVGSVEMKWRHLLTQQLPRPLPVPHPLLLICPSDFGRRDGLALVASNLGTVQVWSLQAGKCEALLPAPAPLGASTPVVGLIWHGFDAPVLPSVADVAHPWRDLMYEEPPARTERLRFSYAQFVWVFYKDGRGTIYDVYAPHLPVTNARDGALMIADTSGPDQDAFIQWGAPFEGQICLSSKYRLRTLFEWKQITRNFCRRGSPGALRQSVKILQTTSCPNSAIAFLLLKVSQIQTRNKALNKLAGSLSGLDCPATSVHGLSPFYDGMSSYRDRCLSGSVLSEDEETASSQLALMALCPLGNASEVVLDFIPLQDLGVPLGAQNCCRILHCNVDSSNTGSSLRSLLFIAVQGAIHIVQVDVTMSETMPCVFEGCRRSGLTLGVLGSQKYTGGIPPTLPPPPMHVLLTPLDPCTARCLQPDILTFLDYDQDFDELIVGNSVGKLRFCNEFSAHIKRQTTNLFA